MKNPDQTSLDSPGPPPAPLTPLSGALQVAGYGIRVFPVYAAPGGICACDDGKLCSSPGKHPIQRAWQQNATTLPDQIQAWAKRWPNCNWGMRTDDLPTADIDPRAGGTLEAAATKLPATAWQVKTGGGGWHWGYLPPTTGVPRGGNNLLGPGLDVKAKGGFVVAVGSIHASGEQYTWYSIDGSPPDTDGIVPWPPAPPTTNGSGPGDMRGTPGAPVGGRSTLASLLNAPPDTAGSGRNEWLTKVAGHVFRHFPYDDGALGLVQMANSSLAEPLDEQELSKIIGSIGHTQDDKDSLWYKQEVAKTVQRLQIREDAQREVRRQSWREPPPMMIGTEFLQQVFEEDPWAVVDLLPAGGNALLAAQFKVGKTHLLLNLLQSMCDRQPFLGRYPTLLEEGGRVGYFNYELPPLQIHKWVKALNIRNHDRFSIVNLRGFNVRIGAPEGDEWAIEQLKRLDIQVWIIDPYAMAFAGESENDNTEVARFTASLDSIKEQAGVDIAILGAHFGRQTFESGDEHVRGATRLDDWADARWIMTRNFENERFFSASGRDVQVDESRLAYNATTRRMTLLEGTRAARSPALIEGRILKYIAKMAATKHGDEFRAAITKHSVEINVPGGAVQIRSACKTLIERGSLVLRKDLDAHRLYPPDHPDLTTST